MLTECYRRVETLLHKPRHWTLRPRTIDRRIFRHVVIQNEYRLPPRFEPDDVLLDIGAHVGSFALAALRRGAGMVHCHEADPDNFRLLQRHLRPYRDRVTLSAHAVWRSDLPATDVPFYNPTPRNTGAGGVAADGHGLRVPARAFDEVIAEATRDGRRVRLAKLDCEGSEWPILLTSRILHLVDSLCGEYHLGDYGGPFAVAGYPRFTADVLACCLAEQGFRVRTRPSIKDPRTGLFFAGRLS